MSDSGADKPMFDPRSRLDEKHIAILDEFKEKVSQYEMDEEERQYFMDEMCLCRYLRARNYDVDKAYKMITDTIEWRRVNRPDKITLADIEPMARTGCVYINGLDKAGRPIIYARPALEDNLKEPVSTEVKYKHLAYWVEKGFTMMDRAEGVEGFTLITDYKNFGRRHMNMEANNVVMNYLNNHCPERMGKTFFLDPPWLFWIAWKVISPFLSQATLDKVSFIKSSSKGDRRTFPEMFAVIDEAKLEEEYGGQGKYVYDYEEYAKTEQPPR